MKLRHCRLQLRVGSIWNKLTIVQFGSFYSSASKWIGQKPDHWNPTNQIFSESQYLAVFKYRLHFLIRYTELELGSDENGWPLIPHWGFSDDDWPKIRRSYGVSSWSKQCIKSEFHLHFFIAANKIKIMQKNVFISSIGCTKAATRIGEN